MHRIWGFQGKIHIVVFCVMTQCRWVGGCQQFRENMASIFHPEYRDCTLFWNTGTQLLFNLGPDPSLDCGCCSFYPFHLFHNLEVLQVFHRKFYFLESEFSTKDKVNIHLEANGWSVISGKFSVTPDQMGNCACLTLCLDTSALSDNGQSLCELETDVPSVLHV